MRITQINQRQDNFVEGISQQAAIKRTRNQLEDCVNFWPSPMEGLIKRPPLMTPGAPCSNLSSDLSKIWFGTQTNDDYDKYQAFFYANGLNEPVLLEVMWHEVYTSGTDQVYCHFTNLATGQKAFTTVSRTANQTYASTRPRMKMYSYLDTVFLWFPSEICELKTETEVLGAKNYIQVHIKQGNYGRTYKIVINGVTVSSYETPDGSETAHVTSITTEHIAQQLYNNLDLSSLTAGEKEIEGSVVSIGTTSAISSCTVTDGIGGTGVDCWLNCKVEKITDLINPNNRLTHTSYWAVTNEYDDTIYFHAVGGAWQEKAIVNYKLPTDHECMPFVLKFGDTVSSSIMTPEDFTCGDADTNPVPTFGDGTRSIKDMCIYRNRLAILTDDTICLSASGDIFNFNRGSISTLSDSDPIDLNVTGDLPCESMTVMGDDLIIMTPSQQFRCTAGQNVLTPTSARVSELSRYDSKVDTSGIEVLGRKIYYLNEESGFSNLKEYYNLGDVSDVYDELSLSQAVERLVPAGVKVIAGSPSEHCLLMSTGDNNVYVYNYLYNSQGQRIQSAWTRWELPKFVHVTAMMFHDSRLWISYCIADDTSPATAGTYAYRIAYMDFSGSNVPDIADSTITDAPTEDYYRVYLDYKLYDLGVSDYDLTATWDDDKLAYKIQFFGDYYVDWSVPGLIKNFYDGKVNVYYKGKCYYDVDLVNGGYIDGPQTDDSPLSSLIIGLPLTSTVIMSPLTYKTTDDSGGIKTEPGKFVIRDITLNTVDSGEYTISVDNSYQIRDYKHRLRMLGQRGLLLSDPPIDSKPTTAPVRATADDTTITITSDSMQPVNIVSADWGGRYTDKRFFR